MQFLGIFKHKMINFDDVKNKNKTKHNSNWWYIPDYPFRSSRSGEKKRCLI